MGVTEVLLSGFRLTKSAVLQIEDNIASLKFLDKLTPEVMTKIDDIFGNKPEGVKTYFSYN